MNFKAKPHILFQYLGIEAFDLLEYNGSLAVENLQQYGDFGLGCFNALDGELITFDGKNYHATSDGKLKEAHPKSFISCAYLTYFSPLHHLQINHSMDFLPLQDAAKNILTQCGHVLSFTSDKVELMMSPIEAYTYMLPDYARTNSNSY